MTTSPLPIVHALHKWSEPNAIGVYPFLPHDIVQSITALALIKNRESWQKKRATERKYQIYQDCSVAGRHPLSWQWGVDYKRDMISHIDRELARRIGLMEMWDMITTNRGAPPVARPSSIYYNWNKWWMENRFVHIDY
jgi:hypothetical protein